MGPAAGSGSADSIKHERGFASASTLFAAADLQMSGLFKAPGGGYPGTRFLGELPMGTSAPEWRAATVHVPDQP
ncbi:hypothetical protein DVW87_07035 [Sphingomonas aracearum]|uniref:Uncharacterized protein n=1 Tax=Sphingomonas aracearum TaxID=2283317 RepID=A0A369VY90_9SPHN|nr:hypothetical protein DVW87_07035 [Sphingomonas aracearum]